ncbi:NADH-quinone oxidoreductase subunit NuoN [Planomonospora sp. ID91781]|uniref:NADH-quinone oxidoreductase subunit N n=3 Tax=Planomonospora TaxID=1998 RepID=A0A161LLU7_9ACTN|nr:MULTISPECIES: NADH-quinone oxidoreductase subunit NuoN [Planomonospora]MBG0820348.1 NADH-quinone oxidoreductase subunit NuoN [Planomonospora sp. ID91781]GAT68065.1 NADH:ubiquinone oxidoreductase subunit N [Planomonospora sphaerica]GGK79490.1 NADH-quinone oxidoreductase subunit N [Planomonospora parontospora]GII11223.1 NADH-quinone oxidoreductase subunit N [Planomonospora parontospora subsp. parontospora]
MNGTTIPAPTIEYALLAPMLIVFGAAIVGVLVEAFFPRYLRKSVHVPLTLLALAGAFLMTVLQVVREGVPTTPSAMGAVAVDGPALFIWGLILVLAIVSTLLINDEDQFVAQAAAVPGSADEEEAVRSGYAQTEVYPLLLFSVGGMMLFPASNDLLIMFVALEVLSLPLYLLCGLARRRRLLSQEASVKYFLLGAFSSAFFLYGMALMYGYAGSLDLKAISAALGTVSGQNTLLLAGTAMLGVGLLFKLGAAPFQAWKPDVYQGAPTAVTALMASTVLVSAFGALLRVFWVALGNLDWDWRPVMWGVAILTMVVGAILAITQTDIKRMLAYSSIAHSGFILTGVIATGAFEQNQGALSAILFYLAAYGFTTVGAFAVVTMVRDAGGEAGHLSRWAGLGKRAPILAGIFAFFLLAFAGIPLTSGFFGKYAVFSAAVAGDALPLVVVGVVTSAIAAFFYVRVIVLMFFSEPAADGPTIATPTIGTSAVVALAAAATVVLGVFPQPVLDLAGEAASALFIR